MDILYLKALHIIGFVAWFAGLFYLGRILVYHREAFQKAQPEQDILCRQFNQMEWRVYKAICNPAMMITWTCGLIMLYLYGIEWLKSNGWMHLKLTLLLLLLAYHIYTKRIIKQLEVGNTKLSSTQLRMLNEVPTLFLIAIPLLAVLRDSSQFGYIFGAVAVVGVLMYLFIKRKQANA